MFSAYLPQSLLPISFSGSKFTPLANAAGAVIVKALVPSDTVDNTKGKHGQEVPTNLGLLHEAGHEEAWIIARDAVPTRARVLDYGTRWPIENLFSDFKTRGVNLEQSPLVYADRLARLILILSLVLHWAAIAGFKIQRHEWMLGSRRRYCDERYHCRRCRVPTYAKTTRRSSIVHRQKRRKSAPGFYVCTCRRMAVVTSIPGKIVPTNRCSF